MRSESAVRLLTVRRRRLARHAAVVGELPRLELTEHNQQIEKLRRRERGMLEEMRQVENILAEALGYHHDHTYGWVIGDHTPITLAMEARRRLQESA